MSSKDNKLDQVFEMLDDEFAKKNINILLSYNSLSNNKKIYERNLERIPFL